MIFSRGAYKPWLLALTKGLFRAFMQPVAKLSMIGDFINFMHESTMPKKSVFAIFALGILILLGGLFLWKSNAPSPDTIRASDYRGGCRVEEYINGECIFDHIKMGRSEYYPLVTENDGIWENLKNYSSEDLSKISRQELERLTKNEKFKLQAEQIARVQSFIDILQRK